MAVRLFVGNLPYDATETRFASTFSRVGISPTFPFRWIVKQERNADSAFVEFADAQQAQEAIRSSTTSLSKGGRSPSTKHEPGRPVLGPAGGSVPGLRRLGPAVVLPCVAVLPCAAAPSSPIPQGRLSR